jgi:hypothetical protein
MVSRTRGERGLRDGRGDARLSDVDIRCVMRDDSWMRTTVDLDADVLQAAKELAGARKMTMGRVLSDLVRKALVSPRTSGVRNGVPLLARRPPGSVRPTLKLVNELLAEDLGDER